jgi:hypothetical protein
MEITFPYQKKIGNFSFTLTQSCRKGVVCIFAGMLFLALGAGEKKITLKHVNVHGKVKKCPEFNHVETVECIH